VRQQLAHAALHARIGQQVGRRRRLVGDARARDGPAAERAALASRVRASRAPTNPAPPVIRSFIEPTP
jgi:hypothetical protein